MAAGGLRQPLEQVMTPADLPEVHPVLWLISDMAWRRSGNGA